MDVECTLNSYNKDGITSTILKVRNVAFDGNKVHLQVVSNDGARLAVLNVVGDGDYQWNDNHGVLVRCKDCEYWKHHSFMNDRDYCELTSTECEGNHFCSWGENKDED